MPSLRTYRSVVLTLAVAFLTLVLATRCTDDTAHASTGQAPFAETQSSTA